MPANISYNAVLFAALIAAMYVSICAHVASRAGRVGKPAGKWFLLSLLLTPIPMVVVMWRLHVNSLGEAQRGRFRRQLEEGRRQRRDRRGKGKNRRPERARNDSPPPSRTCPHCGRPIFGNDASGRELPGTCPYCGMKIGDDNLA